MAQTDRTQKGHPRVLKAGMFEQHGLWSYRRTNFEKKGRKSFFGATGFVPRFFLALRFGHVNFRLELELRSGNIDHSQVENVLVKAMFLVVMHLLWSL
jgi:hypothetical protein